MLYGRTVGYRHHPQLERFRACRAPRAAINAYLQGVHAEASARDYSFDRSKFTPASPRKIAVTAGQIGYEWEWLLSKLRRRNPALFRAHRKLAAPELHPLFRCKPGPIESWEKALR